MSKSAIFVMALLCALILGAVLYLRLEDANGLARAGVLAASVAMAVLMVLFVGRARGRER
jgi:hypothetical protein